ncbi:hypothetical protein F5Y17DRAFT_149102 [Xylariaceae sp. FL0594]|nr:hypothetical protein F5Y17DRAFT_149102 [Xylariaceae sp. FL0594]
MEGDGNGALANRPSQLTLVTGGSLLRTGTQSSSQTLTDSLASNTGTSPSTPTTPATAHTCGHDVDLEAFKTAGFLEAAKRASMGEKRSDQDSRVWPDQAHWKKKALEAKRKNRSCQCLARYTSRLSKRTRIALQIALALFILGAAVGVGFGISKPLGASIWHPDGKR